MTTALRLPALVTGRDRAERLAALHGVTSSASVARTNRFDGRTGIVAIRDSHGWRTVRKLAWTRSTVDRLRAEAVHEVVLRRGLRLGRLPLAWTAGSARG